MWSMSSSSLPAGLHLANATGLISGTPTVSGTFKFTAYVTDSAKPDKTTSAAISLVVAGPSSPLTITTSALPAGTKNTSYSKALQATGGTAPYQWSMSSSSLPAGLHLANATGLISGTPTVSGTFKFTAYVTDSGEPG